MESLSSTHDIPREWLVFFGDGPRAAWWDCFTAPGFRHVCAAAYFPRSEVWVFYDVSRHGTDIVLANEEEAGRLMGAWIARASHIVRIASRKDRTAVPAAFYCVGAIKALVGIRASALSPLGLYRHLLRIGGEEVEIPRGQFIQHSEASEGGPDCGDHAPAGAGAG